MPDFTGVDLDFLVGGQYHHAFGPHMIGNKLLE
jgi:hypothetical protein